MANTVAASINAPLLEITGLDLFYGDAQALSNIAMQVPDKAIVAVVGANGAGKTSLIRAIAGIERPTLRPGGAIRFKGEPIAGLPSHAICELGIGQVAEGRQIFPSMSVVENLEMGGLLKRARANAARTMEDVFALFPRLRERSHQAAGTLSGGEQQMLAIGRCLMGNPELIMFDEPSLGLAPAVVQEVFRVLKALNARGITIVLVEQNVAASLRLATRAYVLETGEVALEGSGAELLADDRVRKAYLGL
jgi:branched-chain amino acid transport system ATP-binding protein